MPLTTQERQTRYLSNPSNRHKKKQRDAGLKARRKTAGICSNCGVRPSRPRVSSCLPCGKQMSATQSGLFARRKAENICVSCGKLPAIPNARHGGKHTSCAKCVIKHMTRHATGSRRHWQIVEAKLNAQNWRCAYTGEPLILGVNASVDHILPVARFPHLKNDPTNLEWVTLQVNVMKNDRTPGEFHALMQTILQYRFAQPSGVNVGALMPCVA